MAQLGSNIDPVKLNAAIMGSFERINDSLSVSVPKLTAAILMRDSPHAHIHNFLDALRAHNGYGTMPRCFNTYRRIMSNYGFKFDLSRDSLRQLSEDNRKWQEAFLRRWRDSTKAEEHVKSKWRA